MTITGCLHEGQGRDTFVLLGVTERPVETEGPLVPVPLAIYWLDSTDGLKALIGEFVDVSGKDHRATRDGRNNHRVHRPE